ncbi:hypothetical protein [Streptomyces sp. YU58]|uniref:hypothetical protein n=1 Tax=Streptomyces sp. SX92 TaxID=3158972 RepID=UPI0027B93655|nr:hypothetical protein [Streptomyces coralus]WLW53317.1 hypothetical protein QU709_18905 [Streptomyces coralus]
MHRLVQAISRTGEDAAETYEEAVGLLLGREQAMLGSVWITHAEVLADHGHEKMASEGVLLLTIAIGNWYATNLLPGRARELHEAAMTGAERVLGPRSPTTLLARQCVAHRCRETEPGRAMRLLTENVAVAKRVFGRNARRTFNARTSLARLKLHLGDIGGGLSLAVRNARRAERALGGDDPVVLAADAVVAQGWRMRAESDPDRYAVRAAAEIERLLIKAIRLDGASSETVLDLMWELGGVREATGDLAGAIRMTQEYLEKYSVPPDSMDLSGMTARVRIVQLLVEAGHPQQARELAITLLAGTEQELAGSEVGSRFRDALAALVVRIAPADDT